MKRIHIFKTGTHTDSSGQTLTFSEADLTKAIAAYNPAVHQAPIVVGHPKTDAPAFGWVHALAATGGNLFATPEQVNTEFSEQVKAGAYKKVSASFYPPNSPANPVKGSYYLRHVGFLGAEPPAIKGLQPVEFAEDASDAVTVTVDFSEADNTTSTPNQTIFEQFINSIRTLFFGESTSAQMIDIDAPIEIAPVSTNLTPINPIKDNNDMTTPAPVTPPVQPTPATPSVPQPVPAPANLTDTAKDTEIAELKAKLAAKDAADTKAVADAQQKANSDFSEGLANDGKIAPKDKELVTAILNGLDTASSHSPVEFGEGDSKQPLKEALKDKLSDANTDSFAHLFSEAAGKQTTANSVPFDAPPDTTIDADRLALHQEALTYSEVHKVDYATAAVAISR